MTNAVSFSEKPGRTGASPVDPLFRSLTLGMALTAPAILCLIGVELVFASRLTLHQFGWQLLVGAEWAPIKGQFGAMPFLLSTWVSSTLALAVAVPFSIGAALFVADLAQPYLRKALALLLDLFAAVPSVIFGLWGVLVMVPWLRESLFPRGRSALGFHPGFELSLDFESLISGGIVIAIMIVPMIASVALRVLKAVPRSQYEAAYALGGTRWEVTTIVLLGGAWKGLVGAVILGLGRALGETIAVTMVMGSRPELVPSSLAPGATLASIIANEFAHASSAVHLSALFELGLLLLGITVLVNAIAQLLVRGIDGALPTYSA